MVFQAIALLHPAPINSFHCIWRNHCPSLMFFLRLKSPWSWYNSTSYCLHPIPQILLFHCLKTSPMSPSGHRCPQPFHCLFCCIINKNKAIIIVILAVIWHQSAEINGIHTKKRKKYKLSSPDTWHCWTRLRTFLIFHKMEGKPLWLLNVLTYTVHTYERPALQSNQSLAG